VEYYGTGPLENSSDRRRGALLGRYDYNAVQNATPYLVPQECGNRTGVRHAAVLNAAGDGLVFVCEEGMDMSALPYTAHELELAHHAFALPPITKTVVRCSMGQMGVGGDDSWGATPHDEFLCRLAPKTSFRFTFYGAANHRFDD
jgi:beta-galactosidase